MFDSIAGRIARHEEEIRRLKLRQSAPDAPAVRFTIEHTFIVGDAWNSATVVPPMMLNVNGGPYSDVDDPTGDPRWESKAIVDYAWRTRTGSITAMGFKFWTQFQPEPATATPEGSFPIPVEITTQSFLQVVPQGAGQDLSVTVWVEHRPGVKDFVA